MINVSNSLIRVLISSGGLQQAYMQAGKSRSNNSSIGLSAKEVSVTGLACNVSGSERNCSVSYSRITGSKRSGVKSMC